MPCVITDGRFDDEDLHAYLRSDDYNIAEDDDGMNFDPEDHEDDTEDRRLFRGDE